VRRSSCDVRRTTNHEPRTAATLSPNATSVLAHHRRVGLARKRLLKLRHVRHDAVHAELRRRVRVGLDLHSQAFGPRVLAPALAVAHEEALFRSEAIER